MFHVVLKVNINCFLKHELVDLLRRDVAVCDRLQFYM